MMLICNEFNKYRIPRTTEKFMEIMDTIMKSDDVGNFYYQEQTEWSGAYGVVESGVSGSTQVSLIGIEGTFVTGTNLRREGVGGAISNLASVPNTITDIYTNKPHWTSTLDGGTF